MQGCATDNSKYSAEVKRRFTLFLERRRDRAGDGPPRPVPAIAIARALGLARNSDHETRKRRVRELVVEMRAEGAPIASNWEGYWAAASVEDFEQTERFLRGMGLGHLATASRIKRSPARARVAGQLELAPLAHRGPTPGRAAHSIYRIDQPTPSRPGETATSPGREGWLF